MSRAIVVFRLLAASAVYGVLALAAGCAPAIVPPANVSEPVTVYIADYGRHSSLLVPADRGHWREYEYGEWNFLALQKTTTWNAVTAVLWPHPGTLGRRWVGPADSDLALQRHLSAERLLAVQVEREQAAALTNDLDSQFETHKSTLVWNSSARAHYVKDSTRYHLLHNCNMQTKQWLQSLGCRVQGPALLSNFRLAPTTHPSTRSDPGLGTSLR